MKVLLLVSAFNVPSQRVWVALRAAGHQVAVEYSSHVRTVVDGVEQAKPDLVVCLFPEVPPPEEVWRSWRTIIVQHGLGAGDGARALERAILDGARQLVVTALGVNSDAGGGQVWARRSVRMPTVPVRRSELHGGVITDAALECIAEVLATAAEPGLVGAAATPVGPGAATGSSAHAATRLETLPAVTWEATSEEIVRRVRAADGGPGAMAKLLGRDTYLFDAHLAPDGCWGPSDAPPGAVLARHGSAVLVGTADGAAWIGQLRRPSADGGLALKLPAAMVLKGALRAVPIARQAPPAWLTYRRNGSVGTLTFRPYNGVLSRRQCRQLLVALRFALSQDTRALVVQGADDVFCGGIHLGVVEAASDPAAEAWASVRAFNDVCRRLCSLTSQLVIVAYTASAGAGGAMLGLGADVVLARDGVVLNPYYDIGLRGSALHTYSLPLRVGADQARRLLTERLPVDAVRAVEIGLVDEVGPHDPEEFAGWLGERAAELATAGRPARTTMVARRTARRSTRPRRPLAYFETAELAEAARDIFDDRDGFARRRRAFLSKVPAERTPQPLASHGNS